MVGAVQVTGPLQKVRGGDDPLPHDPFGVSGVALSALLVIALRVQLVQHFQGDAGGELQIHRKTTFPLCSVIPALLEGGIIAQSF